MGCNNAFEGLLAQSCYSKDSKKITLSRHCGYQPIHLKHSMVSTVSATLTVRRCGVLVCVCVCVFRRGKKGLTRTCRSC